VPDKKRKKPSGAREVTEKEESAYHRTTLPPSPEKERIIESAINREVMTLLDSVGEDGDMDDAESDVPSVPPPEMVKMEKIQEGVQYRIVKPATSLAKPAPEGRPEGEPKERGGKLGDVEAELREREERLLQREVVVGGREKLLRQREEKLHQREVRLRNWEARLMDKEAELRESYPPEAVARDMREVADTQPPPPVRESRPSELRIEIGGGTGEWEMVEEPIDGPEGDS
jgi:hypothetical protein